jgi:hypothetical protein
MRFFRFERIREQHKQKSVHVVTSSKLPSALFWATIAAASSSAAPRNAFEDPDHTFIRQPVQGEVCSSR